jgi:hypothetical protein
VARDADDPATQHGRERRARAEDEEPVLEPPQADREATEARSIAEKVQARVRVAGERDGLGQAHRDLVVVERRDLGGERADGRIEAAACVVGEAPVAEGELPGGEGEVLAPPRVARRLPLRRRRLGHTRERRRGRRRRRWRR